MSIKQVRKPNYKGIILLYWLNAGKKSNFMNNLIDYNFILHYSLNWPSIQAKKSNVWLTKVPLNIYSDQKCDIKAKSLQRNSLNKQKHAHI